MKTPWIEVNPARPGWYPATAELSGRDAGEFARYWDGKLWSAPVRRTDPLEAWGRSRTTPAVLGESGRVWHQNIPEHEVPLRSIDRGVPPVPATPTAPDLLEQAVQRMRERAATYDQPGGERSMARAVAAFNSLTGKNLEDSDGWLLMVCLKLVRDQSAKDGHADSQEDAIAYAALYGESRRAA